jgi:2-aminoadipate transaminase
MLKKEPTKLALSAKALRTHEAPISALIAAAVANPHLISFAAGLVDPQTLPVEECAAITQRIFADRARGQATLQYDTTLGLKPLRQQLLAHLEKLEARHASEMKLSADDILVTTGSQQTLYLVADVLLDPGDIVITANPSYFVFAGTLQSLGARVLAVPVDEDGMDVEAAAALLEQLSDNGELERVKFIYCTSFFDNPTGLTLSLARRQRLLELVQQFSRSHRILILEDAAYRELLYDGEAAPSIKSFDAENRYTILTQTFSKPFAPGIKLGYTACPPDLRDAILHQKGNHDFGSANLSQQIALETMRDGSYARHVEVLKVEYRRKRDLMLAALERHMAGPHPDPLPEYREREKDIHWTHPHGGLYVWLTLPASIDTSRQGAMFQSCIERGVMYVPGDYSFQPDPNGHVPKNHLRLSFGQVAAEQINEGIARLASVVRSVHWQLPTGNWQLSPGSVA